MNGAVAAQVLIESDWNLRCRTLIRNRCRGNGINRIRLGAKGMQEVVTRRAWFGINRIRLEFKLLVQFKIE